MSLDGFGNLYAAGSTASPDLPVLQPAFQAALSTPPDGFFLRLNFANPNAVAISSVNVAGEGSTNIAQNTWIEIHGANFAPPGISATWSTAPDFLQGKMPTQLSGVSVTVNGKPAFIYYVSPTQVNVLTPLDATVGSVQIVLTAGTAPSDPFNANLQTVSPAFLLFGATRYIAATHADNSHAGAGVDVGSRVYVHAGAAGRDDRSIRGRIRIARRTGRAGGRGFHPIRATGGVSGGPDRRRNGGGNLRGRGIEPRFVSS